MVKALFNLLKLVWLILIVLVALRGTRAMLNPTINIQAKMMIVVFFILFGLIHWLFLRKQKISRRIVLFVFCLPLLCGYTAYFGGTTGKGLKDIYGVITDDSPEITSGNFYCTTSDVLTMKQSWSVNSANLGHIPANTKLNISKKADNGWAQTTYNSQTGWIFHWWCPLQEIP